MTKKEFLIEFEKRIQRLDEEIKEGNFESSKGTEYDMGKKLYEKLTHKKAKSYLNETLNIISEALLRGEGVNFLGWGKWEVYERKARNRKSLQTGEIAMYPSKKTVRFKLGKNLKQVIAKSKNEANF